MLYPTLSQLAEKVGNRYLLVNVAAKRAREIAIEAEEAGVSLTEKPVKLALADIMTDRITVKDPEEN